MILTEKTLRKTVRQVLLKEIFAKKILQGLLIDAAKWALSTGKKSLDEKNEYHRYALDYLERRNDGSRTVDYDEKGKGEFVKGMYMALKKAKDEKNEKYRDFSIRIKRYLENYVEHLPLAVVRQFASNDSTMEKILKHFEHSSPATVVMDYASKDIGELVKDASIDSRVKMLKKIAKESGSSEGKYDRQGRRIKGT